MVSLVRAGDEGTALHGRISDGDRDFEAGTGAGETRFGAGGGADLIGVHGAQGQGWPFGAQGAGHRIEQLDLVDVAIAAHEGRHCMVSVSGGGDEQHALEAVSCADPSIAMST